MTACDQVLTSSFDDRDLARYPSPKHTSSNHVSLPRLVVDAVMNSLPDRWHLALSSKSTSFALSVAPDVADGIFLLTDLYHSGRAHVAALESQYLEEIEHYAQQRAMEPDSRSIPNRTVPTNHDDTSPGVRQEISLKLAFSFEEGSLYFHTDHRSTERTQSEGTEFKLPRVSFWADYKGEPVTGSEAGDRRDTATLLVDMVRLRLRMCD